MLCLRFTRKTSKSLLSYEVDFSQKFYILPPHCISTFYIHVKDEAIEKEWKRNSIWRRSCCSMQIHWSFESVLESSIFYLRTRNQNIPFKTAMLHACMFDLILFTTCSINNTIHRLSCLEPHAFDLAIWCTTKFFLLPCIGYLLLFFLASEVMLRVLSFIHIWFVYTLFMRRLKTENEYIRLICVSFCRRRRCTNSFSCTVTRYALLGFQQTEECFLCRWRWRWSAHTVYTDTMVSVQRSPFTTAWQVNVRRGHSCCFPFSIFINFSRISLFVFFGSHSLFKGRTTSS